MGYDSKRSTLLKKELIAVNERAFVLSIRARFGGVLVLYFCFISVIIVFLCFL